MRVGSRGSDGHPPGVRSVFWWAIGAGYAAADASAMAGVSARTGRRWVRDAGGVMPAAVVLDSSSVPDGVAVPPGRRWFPGRAGAQRRDAEEAVPVERVPVVRAAGSGLSLVEREEIAVCLVQGLG